MVYVLTTAFLEIPYVARLHQGFFSMRSDPILLDANGVAETPVAVVHLWQDVLAVSTPQQY